VSISPSIALATLSENQALRDLVRGTAVNLDMTFRDVPSLEVLGCEPFCRIIVVYSESLTTSLVPFLEAAATVSTTWMIVVLEVSTEKDLSRAVQAGAVACLSLSQAMQVLPYLLRNILRGTSFNPAYCSDAIQLSADTVLEISQHVVSSGERRGRLPPIPGKLLECLASRANRVVSTTDLKQHAWGTVMGVTDHALHQQISHLRDRLAEFGLHRKLRCLRGRGYMLDTELDWVDGPQS